MEQLYKVRSVTRVAVLYCLMVSNTAPWWFYTGTGIQVPSSNLGGSDFSVSLTGLRFQHHVLLYAYLTNSNGTIYGAINSFLTGTVPTALCIQLITPTSPAALAPFTIKVTAVDNLTDRNPTNVTSATLVNIFKYAGANVLTGSGCAPGTIPVSNIITIPGFCIMCRKLVWAFVR